MKKKVTVIVKCLKCMKNYETEIFAIEEIVFCKICGKKLDSVIKTKL